MLSDSGLHGCKKGQRPVAWLGFFLVVLTVFIFPTAANAGGGCNDYMSHRFSGWSTVPCGEAGTSRRVCSLCGFEETRDVPPQDHVFLDWFVREEATCENAGILVSNCSNCGKEETKEVPPLPHQFGEQRVVLEPLCEQAGVSEAICRICGAKQIHVLDPVPHDDRFSHFDAPNGCDAGGYKVYRCSRCQRIYREEFDGHLMRPWTVLSEAGCEQDGLMTRSCQVCGVQEEYTLKATGHRYGADRIVKPGTCCEEGLVHRNCEICGKLDTAVLGMIPHDFLPSACDPAGCTEPGQETSVCARCRHRSVRILPPTGHRYGPWQTVRIATCQQEGLQSRVCQNCGHVQEFTLPALQHFCETWETTLEPSCSQAGAEASTCALCETLVTRQLDKLPHQFGSWRKTQTADCALATSYQRVCRHCQATEIQSGAPANHVYHPWTIALEPTCTLEGMRQRSCKYCGHVQWQALPLRKHSAGSWEVTREARLYESGLRQKRCRHCQVVLKEQTFYPGDKHFAVTFCPLGIRLRDVLTGQTDEIAPVYRVLPVDITKNGSHHYPLIADDTYRVGEVIVAVDGEHIQISYTLFSDKTKVLKERLQILKPGDTLKIKDLINNRKGHAFSVPMVLKRDIQAVGQALIFLRLDGVFLPEQGMNQQIDWSDSDVAESIRTMTDALSRKIVLQSD